MSAGNASLLAVVVASAIAACSQTTRVSDDTSAENLGRSRKAVAIMRLGAASPTCRHVGLWLGVREGEGFRAVKPVAVINQQSTAEAPIAEVELDPGEYHVVSYACGTGTSAKQVSGPVVDGLVRTSYASFRVEPGEIVNVGSFEFHATRVGTNAFGRPVKTTVSIVDWPLADLDRYKQKRPALFAQMKTRLMTVTPESSVTADDCSRLAALAREGKVAALPAACARETKEARRSR